MRRRDYTDAGEPPDALDWDLDLNLELELRDDQQSRLYRYLSEGHRPRYRNEPPRRAATVTALANRSVSVGDGIKTFNYELRNSNITLLLSCAVVYQSLSRSRCLSFMKNTICDDIFSRIFFPPSDRNNNVAALRGLSCYYPTYSHTFIWYRDNLSCTSKPLCTKFNSSRF